MSEPRQSRYITVKEYLAYEERASTRHEFVDGQMFAMSGVTKRHNIIAGNIYTALRLHVRGSRCRAFMSDVKALVETTNSFYYPDVMVSCEAFNRNSFYSNSPVLLVEVLSRSTSAIDRREKMHAYRQIPALKEYLIVHQSRQRAELHRRKEDDSWELLEFQEGMEIVLTSVPVGSLVLSMSEIYEDVDFAEDDDLQVREDTALCIPEEDFLDW